MRTNVVIPRPTIFTHEGAKATHLGVYNQLRRSVLANMLFEDTFYEDGQSIADRIGTEVQEILKYPNGAKAVAELAVEARSEMKLRHVPLLLISYLIKANTPATRTVIADVITRTVQRPDELGELISLFWRDKKQMLPKQMKLGLAGALKKFNEYSLAKYNRAGDAIKLKDVIFLVHPKADTAAQQELWNRLIEDKLAVPDTWETELSAGKDKKATFTRLLEEDKLGSLALLRNLRNMTQSGVSETLICSALGKMKTEKVLPFRFITAAKYSPMLEPQLEAAMLRSLVDHTKFPGKTVLVVDNSGSMGYALSGKSELLRDDAAQALAMLLREVCENVQIIVFGNTAGVIPPRRGFALRDVIEASTHRGNTNTDKAITLANQIGYDRIIVITDEQSSTPIPKPLTGSKAYVINVAAYRNGIGYGNYIHIDGWSEAVIDYIQQFELLEQK